MNNVSHITRAALLAVLTACLLFTAACGSKQPTDAPEGCLRAGNDAVDFTFCYTDTWQLDRNDGMIGIKYNIAQSGTIAYASISAQAYTLSDSSLLANQYWDSYRDDLKEIYGDSVTISSEKEETQLGGVIANRNRYAVVYSDVTYRFEQVICIRKGAVYLLTFTTPEPGYETAISCFETAIETFAFL